ncbi:unnamed protein product [Leptidea sinapis]|uniref:Uncharacterized protein n=1 Tax=Leptidea sinapis TaxID=189913 RepID=A0A5E4R0M2_9NEOP|nr:unnamed protein product [Leptidea sinapis]
MNNSSDVIYWSELHCSKDALTDTYGWFMQFLLAILAFTCLIGKRFCEPRYARRPWLIWFYDTSKQGLGALIIHAANCVLYAALATFAKSILALVLRLPPVVAVLSTLRLSPVSDPRLELAVVMLIIPFFVNILIFWVTDNFLMYHPRGVSSKIKTKVRYQSIKKEKTYSDEEDHSADERLLTANV